MPGLSLPGDLELPLLKALSDNAIVAVTDAAGRITYANDWFCRISGYDLDTLIGANHRLLNSGEHPPEFFREMYGAIGSGKTWRGTICNRRRNGEFYWVDTAITPVLQADGRPRAYIAIRTEVTHHIRVQQELAAARAAAERTTQARERFLANLSHELRTPLTAIIGFSEVLSRTDLKSGQKDSVGAILASADALRGLVNDVLTLAQSRAAGSPISPRTTDLIGLANDCLKMVALRAEEKGLLLQFRASPDVPANGLIDPGRLRQVLLNLLGNALKFTDAGMVSLSLDWVDGVLRCEVADTGCGFAPEDKERLFAAFEQVSDPAGPHPEGAGLGLPICRGLLGAMGGAIDADSIPGDGARFWLTAPCPAVAAQARQPDTVVQPGADILVVEDSPEIQQLMTAVLGSAGHRIEIACNGREGVDALRRRSFDLCLMDLRMPVMGGDEAVKMIRADPDVRVRATPVVMVSAEAEPGDQGRFRAIGFDDALGKPLDIARLLGAVEAWRGRSSEAMDVKAKAS